MQLTQQTPGGMTLGRGSVVRGLAVEDCHVVTEAGDESDHLPVVATLRPEIG